MLASYALIESDRGEEQERSALLLALGPMYIGSFVTRQSPHYKILVDDLFWACNRERVTLMSHPTEWPMPTTVDDLMRISFPSHHQSGFGIET